jgi:hypothetical protein
MEPHAIIRNCDLIKENQFYKWYGINHIKGLEAFVTLVFSKETRIAHLIHTNGDSIPFAVSDSGELKTIDICTKI